MSPTLDVRHTPVMVAEVLSSLGVRPAGAYIDCTAGEGGHAAAVLGATEPGPRLLGIDLDTQALDTARRRLEAQGEAVKLEYGSYVDLMRMAGAHGFLQADGVLFDLGVSSMQVEAASRGFSFSREGRLDMRFDPAGPRTAFDLVNGLAERELADIIYQLGEEPRSRGIARSIVQARPIETTVELADAVGRAIGRSRSKNVHPATRTFQALRMAVNGELDNIREGLEQAIGVLRSGGRLVAIGYHSLEDGLVKRVLRREASDCVCPPGLPECVCDHRAAIRLISRRVIRPTREEVRANPRSRSARMRVAERL